MTSSSISRVRHVFTYGTLMSIAQGERGAHERAMMRAFATCVGRARIQGRMFDAGIWPGVALGGGTGEVVHGELWRLPPHMPELLAVLDRYEGCAPESPFPRQYERRRIRVRAPDGRRVTAWIYAWALPTDGLAWIADGRWRGPSLSLRLSGPPALQRAAA